MQFDWSRAFEPISQEPDFSPILGQKNVRYYTLPHYTLEKDSLEHAKKYMML